MTEATCAQSDCGRPTLARGLCNSHYSRWRRQVKGRSPDQRKHPLTCAQCGQDFLGFIPTSRMCSRRCAGKSGAPAPVIRPPKVPRDPRGPLRRAVEDRDWELLTSSLRSRSTPTPLGCWEWTGRVDSEGYPRVNIGGRTLAAHRLAALARYQADLGSQAAHHTCANSRCVNPDHVQAVTHRDNVAEMLARQSYVARIRDLEQALDEVAPGHPLLATVPIV